MSFLAPGFLIAAVAAACGVIALHFIVTRRPRSVAFPTARFVPEAPIAARARSLHLSDLVLLAVRVLVILLAGAALARPVFTPQRERTVRVIAADVSGSVASLSEVRDSVRALVRPGDAIIVFDTAARPVDAPDSVANSAGTEASGSLSAGLIAALRAGPRVRAGADSVELVIVSPVATAERDRATMNIRTQWPGRARWVRVAAASARDSSVLQTRPVAFLTNVRPAFAVARNRIDTVGAVVAYGNAVVAPFERRWRFVADSMKGSRVIARWSDGEPAAIQRDSAGTCVRSILTPLDSVGDLALQPSFVRFRTSLSASCDFARPTSDTALGKMLAGSGRLASTAQFPIANDVGSPLARWLVAIAIILAIVEMVLRRAKRDTEVER